MPPGHKYPLQRNVECDKANVEHVEDCWRHVFTHTYWTICVQTNNRQGRENDYFKLLPAWKKLRWAAYSDRSRLHFHKVKCSGTLQYHCKKRKWRIYDCGISFLPYLKVQWVILEKDNWLSFIPSPTQALIFDYLRMRFTINYLVSSITYRSYLRICFDLSLELVCHPTRAMFHVVLTATTTRTC